MDTSAYALTPFGKIIWEDRYALKDQDGNLIESSILDTFRRVAKAQASKENNPVTWTENFYHLMAGGYFCPAGRILAHSGTHYSQLLNCFVLPFRDDSLEEIMHTTSDMAIVQKFGGGCGENFSVLRPSGSYVKGVNGRSCGVIGFISMMSTTSEVVEQGGSRRGANLGLLEVWHPDVWEFISYKTNHNWDRLLEYMDLKDAQKWEAFKFENLYKWQMFNVSIGVDDAFMKAVDQDMVWPFMWKDKEWKLYTVKFTKKIGDKSIVTTHEVTADCEVTALWKVRRTIPYPTTEDKFEVISQRTPKAREIWKKICYNAWADGCPGLLNMSTIRKFHNLEYAHPVLATNPCGEQPLPAFGCCLLSSLVLSSFVNNGDIDFKKLRWAVSIAVRLMDNVIDNCDFPLPEMKVMELNERRIGLGTMGVHDMLMQMQLGYDTEAGRAAVEKVLTVIRDEAYLASVDLAKEKGSFPLFDKQKYLEGAFVQTLPQAIRDQIAAHGIRNSCLLSQAPTGTIGTMMNVSTGCEPWFDLSYQRNTRLGSYEDGCSTFLKWRKENPTKEVPDYFKTARKISPEDHLNMMILFGKFVDSSCSKTVNLSNDASVKDVEDIFTRAMANGVKGITVFRDGCKMGVMVSKTEDAKTQDAEEEEEVPVSKTPPAAQEDTRLNPLKRGNVTYGTTTRINMQSHHMYVTVNRNVSGAVVEVFATVGESKNPKVHHTSGIEDSWAEGLGKIASLALRAGVDPQSIIRNLKNIPSDKPVFTTIGDVNHSELIPSPPHAIARVLEEALRIQTKSDKIQIDDGKVKEGKRCSSCGSTNLWWRTPTCYECRDCPNSGCLS